MDIKSKIGESKVKQAEAKIRTEKIRRDAAYGALVRAQKRNAGPNERRRLADIYDRAEDRLQQAEDAAREMKRKAMGLKPIESERIGVLVARAKKLSSGRDPFSFAPGSFGTPQSVADAEARAALVAEARDVSDEALYAVLRAL